MTRLGIIEEGLIKAALAFMTLALNVSCAEMQGHPPDVSGPKATVMFISPYLEDRFMSLDRLALFVLESDETCALTSKGRIPLSDDTNKSPADVPANRRAYFRLWQSHHEFMGSSGRSQKEFSFIPAEGMEYIIEHIDNPANLRAKFYQRGPDNKKIPIEVQGTGVCNIKKE